MLRSKVYVNKLISYLLNGDVGVRVQVEVLLVGIDVLEVTIGYIDGGVLVEAVVVVVALVVVVAA